MVIGKTIEKFESRGTKEVVEIIEFWTNYGFYRKYNY